MRVLKPVFYSAIAITTLVGCSSVSKVAVPTGSNTVVNISAKKAELTAYEKDNWQHLDLATDTIPGMSVNKAYEFLKGKKGVEVVVGVVDSGTDLKHEDLVDVAWVNTKEIEGNGIDDDKNGYVDDINGWNFLGSSYKEHLEYERILMNPSVADAETLKEVKAFQKTKVDAAKKNAARYKKMLDGVTMADAALAKHFGKADYTKEQVLALKTTDVALTKAAEGAKQMYGFGLSSLTQAKEELAKLVKTANATINGDNLKTDYRTVVGDNAYDINDKPGYGDANIGHSEKGEAHGSHVSGIIGATRNNGKGMNGVANNVKMMAVRSVSDGDEYDKDVALGIRYAVDNGAKVINTSFGKAFSPNKEWVYDAIKYAASKDVLIVNAAGNSGENIDVDKTFPNDAPDQLTEVSDNFLTIGAMSANYNEKLPAGFSNYGKVNVDIFAPGVQIHSTFPDNAYKKISGTSMASPATAGVAALIRSYYPQLSASQVKHIIMNSGTKIDLMVTKPGSTSRANPAGDLVPFADLSVSGRIVNAYNAVLMADRMVNGRK
ncbi:S8 family peptidase [Tenacibaculum haliotis]|uniref:S8 family peptidase n=1 Tax=Tenacibaculum haliotis TaxID=1888914 RepID=UPI0021AF1517|nr:S8 family peptidase [Tenacibaculum haliotis]MCT4700164.1 S8 family peptidase [Tenacibaculum haliotis]